MNVKRFTGRTSKDALAGVRQAFGDDAVVLSTRPCEEGVEVLAMAGDTVAEFEKVAVASEGLPARNPAMRSNLPRGQAKAAAQLTQSFKPQAKALEPDASVDQDVAQLQMSTLSFQEYVRERMLRRRRAEMQAAPEAAPELSTHLREAPSGAAALRERSEPRRPAAAAPAPRATARPAAPPISAAPRREVPVLREEVRLTEPMWATPRLDDPTASRRDQSEMMLELRSMKGLIEDRFGALAFMDKLQRQPRHAQLAQRLLDCGFSPVLCRRLVEALPSDSPDDMAWAAGVLERNLMAADADAPAEDDGGVFALIGATGVGKTAVTAKLAAHFATRHGAAHLGLITLDAYRVAAHEQLRGYGRILGVPVHTAHDRASLEDLLELLSGKRLVLIDTAGMAQRDARTRELLDMLAHASVQRLLVVSAAAQAETTEDVLAAYKAAHCSGVVLSKIDETVKLAPVLDSMIRHKLRVVGVSNGQRVPEDWHRLSANALVHRAMRGAGSPAWRLDQGDMNLVFAGLPMHMPDQLGPTWHA